MQLLSPCATCARHARRSETTCPFCGAPFVAVAESHRMLDRRVARMVRMLAPAILVGVVGALDGCGSTPTYGTVDAGIHEDGGADAAHP